MKTFILSLFLAFSFNTLAQSDSTKCPCCSEDYRAFDFWVGDWTVKDSAGTLLGHNKIELAQGGCTLIENWTGAKGSTGTSMSFYHSPTKQWHQSWMDAGNGSIIMNGVVVDGSMVLFTEPLLNPKTQKEIINRTTWSPLPDGGVLHVWEISTDKGESWRTVFRGYYSKEK